MTTTTRGGARRRTDAGRLVALPVMAALAASRLQLYRAAKEQEVLAETFPDYTAYPARTARLVAGVF